MSQAQYVPKKVLKTINIEMFVIINYNFNLESIKCEFFLKRQKTWL